MPYRLVDVSASWHSAGSYAMHWLDMPVGILLMDIFDHLILGLAIRRYVSEVSLRVLVRILLMCCAAS